MDFRKKLPGHLAAECPGVDLAEVRPGSSATRLEFSRPLSRKDLRFPFKLSETALMLPGARDTAYILTYLSMNLTAALSSEDARAVRGGRWSGESGPSLVDCMAAVWWLYGDTKG